MKPNTDTDIENLKKAALSYLDKADEFALKGDYWNQPINVSFAGVCIARIYELKKTRGYT